MRWLFSMGKVGGGYDVSLVKSILFYHVSFHILGSEEPNFDIFGLRQYFTEFPVVSRSSSMLEETVWVSEEPNEYNANKN